jgi:tetratricopeptide (TPR) repeat protein
MKNLIKTLLIASSLFGFAQNPIEPDSIALVEDKFQELFYEALKQKGIENYDRAIINLDKALLLKPENPTILHEIGRNYLAQKKYPEAEQYIKRAIDKMPDNKWVYLSLYDVYYENKDYENSIDIVQKLIAFNDKRKEEYQDDLVSLYMYTGRFDKALILIEELEKTAPYDQTRELYKLQILKNHKNTASDISRLEGEISQNPQREQPYISLIYLYSESNQEEKAFEVAKRLAKNIPDSDWAHVSLFKFYLEEGNVPKAVLSIQKALESTQIDNKIKHRIINEFLIFVNKNPQYDKELEKAVSYFKSDPDVAIAKEIGKFYYTKQNWQEASDYFEISLKNDAEDYETILLLLQTYTEMGNFDVLLNKSNYYVSLYPLQPEFYYYSGLASNQLQNYKKAKEVLAEGLDYLVDNVSLEINFNIQLGQAFLGLGNEKEKEKYFQKAESLMQSLKK